MGTITGIEWTDHTFNPWWGCTKVSQGCKHCYAETQDHRIGGDHWGPGKPRRTMSVGYWLQPLAWNKAASAAGVRRRVFCASMADVFDPEAPPGALGALWDLIRRTPMLDWQLLTKRPERILQSLPDDWGDGYPNVWLGTSVEDQEAADLRIPELLRVPAVIRFLSCEPLLGPVTLFDWDTEECRLSGPAAIRRGGRTPNTADFPSEGFDDSQIGIHWVIGGGESGHEARPCHPEWARGLRDQCLTFSVPFFWKQWGEWLPYEETGNLPYWRDQTGVDHDSHGLDILDPETGDAGKGWYDDIFYGVDFENNEGSDVATAFRRVGKSAAGRLLDGQEWSQFPCPS